MGKTTKAKQQQARAEFLAPLTTVHAYRRQSDVSQLEGDSERRQTDYYEQFLLSGRYAKGLQFHDGGRSAFKPGRQKELREVLAAIDDGRIKSGDILYVENIDRLCRLGIEDTQDLINRIRGAGVSIAISMPIAKVYRAGDKNNLGDSIELAIFAYNAWLYSKNLSDRLKGAWIGAREKMRKGERIRHNVPGWLVFDPETETFRLKPECIPAIAYMFNRLTDGSGSGFPALVAELHERFKPIGRKAWNETYVRYIVRGRQVLGEYQPTFANDKGEQVADGEPIALYFPAVVDEQTWMAAQNSIDERRKETGPSAGYVNIFKNLVWYAVDQCPAHVYTYQQTRADGRKVIIRRLKSYKAQEGVPGASTATVDLPRFEAAILSYMREVDVREFEKGITCNSELQAANAALTKCENHLTKLKALFQTEDDEDQMKQINETMKEKRLELAGLKSQVAALAARANNHPTADVGRVKALLDLEHSPENRTRLRDAIKRVVRRICIVPVKLGQRKCDPVATAVELEFKAGHRRSLAICLNDNVGFSDMSPTGGPLAERKDLKQWANKFRLAMRELYVKPAKQAKAG